MKDDRKQHPERLSYELLDSINQSADTNDFLRLPHLLIDSSLIEEVVLVDLVARDKLFS